MRFSSFLLSLAVGTALTTAVPAANPSPTQAPIKPAKTRTKSSTHSPTSSAGLLAVDINTARPSSFWTCLAKTHQKVVIKGYGQACKHGGAVDKDFVRSYEAAKAVGIPHIDAYMFPCTGKQPTGLACKTPATQIAEFEAAIAAANMTLDSVWLDVEPGPDSGRPCAAWNLTPKTKNLALARQYVDLIRKSSLRWGVYANGNEWTRMFPARTDEIGSDLPLWAVQADQKPGVASVHTFMGGWTEADGKQYAEEATVCGGEVDKDSFSS